MTKVDIFVNYLRKTEPYNNWRQSVKKEQGNRCQFCGSRYKTQVHHTVYFKRLVKEFLNKYNHLDTFRDIDELVDYAEDWDRLWDTNLGEVLCSDCHKLEHNVLDF